MELKGWKIDTKAGGFLLTPFAIKHEAWLCVGDFDETHFASGHFSCSPRLEWQMRALREAYDDFLLLDLGWSGVEYTWNNGQGDNSTVKARLNWVSVICILLNYSHIRYFDRLPPC